MKRRHFFEVLFQVIIHIIVFIFYSFNRRQTSIQEYQVVFFTSYMVAAAFINYFLLPCFLYQKKYLRFAVYVILTIALVMATEELLLEQIFFPDTRGSNFPGIFFTLVGSLPPIVILTGIKFAWDAILKQHEVEELESAVKESELQFLKSQINPHFLFNNLNNIYSYALESSKKTPQLILELSSFLRYTLYECQKETIIISREVEQLSNYIELNKLQIEERSCVNFNHNLSYPQQRIAPLLFLVFIENAFKHSSLSQTNNIEIDIDLTNTEEGRIIFTCENNFLQQDTSSTVQTGIGLQNVRKRLELLYPNNYELKVKKDDDRYIVQLKITGE